MVERLGLRPRADARLDGRYVLIVRAEWIDQEIGDGWNIDDQVRKLDEGQENATA